MQQITIQNRNTEAVRTLVAVTDLYRLHFSRDLVTDHIYSGAWNWSARGEFFGDWTVLYEFSDHTTGLSRRADMPQALEALGKRVSTPPTTLAPVSPCDPTAAHQADIAHISTVIGHEAADRGWCGDYERIVRVINRGLAVPMTDRYGNPIR